MKPDWNDWFYYCGLVLLFSGLSLEISIGTALIVIGAIVAAVAVANSYIAVWLSRHGGQ